MKTKIAALTLTGLLALSPLAWSQSLDGNAVADGLSAAADELPGALPFAASAGLDWSDAYIGPLFEIGLTFPVHVGVGFVFGATSLPIDGINQALSGLGQSEIPAAVLPFGALTARLGGPILPFDIGLKYGVASNLKVADLGVQYSNIGLDVRYNLIRENLLLPDVSVGAGASFLSAELSMPIDDVTVGTANLTNPVITFGLGSQVYEVKAQVSKSLLILTPYAGVSAGWGTGSVSSGLTFDGGSGLSDLDNYFRNATSKAASIEADGTGQFLKAYGGASFDLFIVHLDAQGIYNLLDGAWGFTLGGRVQL